MFGYIRPFKLEMKIREYEAYKAVYCGLCSRLGKSFGFFARFTLSYDFTFLSMICEEASGGAPSFETRRCCVNPLKKVRMRTQSEVQCFSADIAVIMLYFKLLDNIRDSGLLKKIAWKFLLPFAKSAYRKAAAARPEAAKIVSEAMEKQAEAEKAGSGSLGEASEPSASAMAGIFAVTGCTESDKRILERMGYLLGRYVYICDAADDFDSDLKSGSYNPLVIKYREGMSKDEALSEARRSLYMTAGEIIKAGALLEKRYYGDIIDNIVGLGLKARVDEIIKKHDITEI